MAVTKKPIHKVYCGRKDLFSLNSTMMFIIKGSHGSNSNRAGSWRVELMQRPWRAAGTGLFPVAYLVCFLTELTTRIPWMAPHTIMWFLAN